MIASININNLRNAEYIQFCRDFLAIVALNDYALLKVASEYTTLNAVVQAIEAVFKTDQGSNITPQIEELDNRRDTAVVGIYKSIDGFTYYFEPTKRQAADILMNHLDVYGTAAEVITQALPAETAVIDKLVADFTNIPDLKTAIELLSLSEWVTELQTVNEQLNQKYIERVLEAGHANPNTIKDLRTQANALYYDLRDMIVAQSKVAKNAPPFPKAMDELNAVVEQYKVLLGSRGRGYN